MRELLICGRVHKTCGWPGCTMVSHGRDTCMNPACYDNPIMTIARTRARSDHERPPEAPPRGAALREQESENQGRGPRAGGKDDRPDDKAHRSEREAGRPAAGEPLTEMEVLRRQLGLLAAEIDRAISRASALCESHQAHVTSGGS